MCRNFRIVLHQGSEDMISRKSMSSELKSSTKFLKI